MADQSTKHTPGPWGFNPKTREIYEDDSEGVRVPIAIVGDYLITSEEQMAADGYLMASSPQLLSALKAVVAVADRETPEFIAARALIAKAEGGQHGR
jgi:hypothetical protein